MSWKRGVVEPLRARERKRHDRRDASSGGHCLGRLAAGFAPGRRDSASGLRIDKRITPVTRSPLTSRIFPSSLRVVVQLAIGRVLQPLPLHQLILSEDGELARRRSRKGCATAGRLSLPRGLRLTLRAKQRL